MKKIFVGLSTLLIAFSAMAIPNYGDPKNILAGSPYWFFRLDDGRWELALLYPRMQQDILQRVKEQLAKYSYGGHEREAEARAVLEKAYRDLKAAYAASPKKSDVPDCSEEPLTRDDLRELLTRTPQELFPIEFRPVRRFMVGAAGPHREDFERRIQLEKAYDVWLQRFACWPTHMKRKSKKLIRQVERHLERAYRTMITEEGLSV